MFREAEIEVGKWEAVRLAMADAAATLANVIAVSVKPDTDGFL